MMHAGRFSLEGANRYIMDYVPFMEEDLGRSHRAGVSFAMSRKPLILTLLAVSLLLLAIRLNRIRSHAD